MVGVSANTLHVLSYLTLFFIGGLDNVVVGDDYDADEHSDTDQQKCLSTCSVKNCCQNVSFIHHPDVLHQLCYKINKYSKESLSNNTKS